MSFADYRLRQRGRAEVDFIVHLSRGSRGLRESATGAVRETAEAIGTLPEDLDERNALLEPLARGLQVFRAQELFTEWHARNHGVSALVAFEEIQPELEETLQALSRGPATLALAGGETAPGYWDGVNFHRTTGGWEGHPYMGFVHGEIVHRRIVEGIFPGGIFTQRRRVAREAPRDDYAHILDMGCSTGHFTQALAEIYPKARITGVDLSRRTLEHAQRVANANGWPWRLLQRPAEDTGLPACEFDLVASYILLHEVPAEVIRQLFTEALRVLAPGGDLLMSDVTRFADMDAIEQWRVDRNARLGGEPYWRSSASLDLKALAEEAGFVDVTAGGLEGGLYPYLVQGRKPA